MQNDTDLPSWIYFNDDDLKIYGTGPNYNGVFKFILSANDGVNYPANDTLQL